MRSTRCACAFGRVNFRTNNTVRDSAQRLPPSNSKHNLLKRVALTILYLAQAGTVGLFPAVLGISKTRAIVNICEVLAVLSKLAKTVVETPGHEELHGIEARVAGALDGTLVAIARPHGHEGWYYRKNYTPENIQAVVDHHEAFRSLSNRSGSHKDQYLLNGSGIRKRSIAPPDMHLLGDARHKVWCHLLTPLAEGEAVSDPKNKVQTHSLEGSHCGRLRLQPVQENILHYHEVLKQMNPRAVAKVVIGCALLPNLLIV
ncbi:hypothetical protein PybrP1_007246 [[Pythium] brassicae (nom. inval.)]|nr:hypothetical protein PybrP1_007246 [[Pythium] brassicae (nom. inval.)]